MHTISQAAWLASLHYQPRLPTCPKTGLFPPACRRACCHVRLCTRDSLYQLISCTYTLAAQAKGKPYEITCQPNYDMHQHIHTLHCRACLT